MPFPLLDPTFAAELTGVPNAQTLAFVKKIIKGILYPDLSVSGRNVTGQVKYGEGTAFNGSVSINIQCDEVITVTSGTVTNTGNQSRQINTLANGSFAFSVAGTQGATVRVTVLGGITDTIIVGTGGTGGGGGGGGGGGFGLPINESDVTNLVSDLAGKVPTTRNLNTTYPVQGGGPLSGDLTISVPQFSSGTDGVVPASTGSPTDFLAATGVWTTPVGVWGANTSYGDGSDGDVILGTNTTLSRDMFYNNLNLAGHTLDPNGWQIFVLGTLDFNGGKITANGLSGALATTGRSSGSLPGSTSPGSPAPSFGTSFVNATGSTNAPTEFYITALTGGAGGGTSSAGSDGANGPGSCCGGSGGGGGGSTSGGAQTGLTVQGGTYMLASKGASSNGYQTAFYGRGNNGESFTGATSGAAGGYGGTSNPSFGQPDLAGIGGKGGQGGGWVSVAAAKMIGNNSATIIEAKGGNGQIGGDGVGAGGGGGGGAGGAGGFICITYSVVTNITGSISSLCNVSGGLGALGGAGGGVGSTFGGGRGGDGHAGLVRVFNVTNLVSGPGAFLPILESDVTNLTTDLATLTTDVAAKTPTSRLITGTAPVRINGGASADLSANLTVSVNQFSSGAAGVVPASGGGTINFLRADGSWNAPSGGGGSGAFRGAWSNVVAYGTGDLVSRGPFVFGAISGNTGSDPCTIVDDFTNTGVWQRNGAGISISGIEAVLVNNTSGVGSSMIRQAAESYGWASRRFIIDAAFGNSLTASVNADSLNFGFIDSSVVSTSNNNGVFITGTWGVNLDTWNHQVTAIVNGSTTTSIALTDILTYAPYRFVRYFLDVIDNGVGAGTCTMTLYRETFPKGRQSQIATFTVTRPTFTNFKFGIGAWAGGSAGMFRVRGAWIRDIGTSNWAWVTDGPSIPNP